jgi:hypothetical protein
MLTTRAHERFVTLPPLRFAGMLANCAAVDV